jgi:hypothetical protein
MTKGWHYESGRHALAARGIPTVEKKKLGTGPYPSDSNTIKKEVMRHIQTFKMKDLEDPENPGTFILVSDTLASGAAGIYIPSEVAQYLGLEIPEDAEDIDGNPTDKWEDWEWAWEEIDEKAGEIADELNKVSGLPGHFYFGINEGWGDYCLFYSWEAKDHPEFDYSGVHQEHWDDNYLPYEKEETPSLDLPMERYTER